ncbi:hypothetical protein HELRODRAFT_154098, partial [Helobdella robusta]|uniref:T-cell immunomodulatory protein TIP C2 domain-containing protein n=1 Tax=Helobdella robusta TaxID=6412 RepID=T1ELD7_HELRO
CHREEFCLLSFSCLIFCLIPSCLTDDTYVLYYQFNASFDGIIAGFADYNADKNVDVFAISNSGQNVDIWLASKDGDFKRETLIVNQADTSATTAGAGKEADDFISGIAVADFNGDGHQDILVSKCNMKANNNNSNLSYTVQVHWGSNIGLNHTSKLDGTYKDEPIIFDYNCDMLPDIMMVNHENNATVWIAEYKNQLFNPVTFLKKFDLHHPHSSAFIQLRSSFNTDLFLTTSDNTFTIFTDGNYEEASTYDIKTKLPVGQSAFADINQDGIIDHLIPVENQIQVYHNGTWHTLVDIQPDYSFDYNHVLASTASTYKLPVNLIIGDYDQDGYPDVLTVAWKNLVKKYVPILLKNLPCNMNNKCVGFGRILQVQEGVLPSVEDNVHVAAFFDYMEDGTLDTLLTCFSSPSSFPPSSFHNILLKNNIASDTCFMKVTVTSGVVDIYPTADRKPHGLNTVGPTVWYRTTKPTAFGEEQRSCASQMSQTSHFSLQLPFILFGLGQTPNFVDEVVITLPQIFNRTTRQKNWTQIIPNSQLLVNPYRPNTPNTWTMQLFVTPSKAIYTTAAVLGATCIGLVFLVGALLIVEKKEDKAERNQESQRFHFDAM